MLDVINKAFLIGVGLAAETKEKIDGHVKELVEKGNLTEKQGKDLVADILKKSEKTRKDLQKHVEKLVEETMHKLHLPTKADVTKLETRIKKLEAAAKPKKK